MPRDHFGLLGLAKRLPVEPCRLERGLARFGAAAREVSLWRVRVHARDVHRRRKDDRVRAWVAARRHASKGLLARSCVVRREADDVFPHRLEAKAALGQDARRNAVLLAAQAKQQVFGPDVVMTEAVGFLRGSMQPALDLGTERYLHRGRDSLPKLRACLDLRPEGFGRHARASQEPAGESFALA